MNHKNQDLLKVLNRQPYPLLFITISGSHLYGFSSADSDYDLRGVHILPIREIIGLNPPKETIEICEVQEHGFPVDLVTHEIKKFLVLLLKKKWLCFRTFVFTNGGDPHSGIRRTQRTSQKFYNSSPRPSLSGICSEPMEIVCTRQSTQNKATTLCIPSFTYRDLFNANW